MLDGSETGSRKELETWFGHWRFKLLINEDSEETLAGGANSKAEDDESWTWKEECEFELLWVEDGRWNNVGQRAEEFGDEEFEVEEFEVEGEDWRKNWIEVKPVLIIKNLW